MAGLLMKDLRLTMMQKNTLLMVGIIAVIVVIGEGDPGFVITYLTFIGVLYTMNTLSYDGADNGNAFLFSLPITRAGYVMEKYVFGLLGGSALWLFGVALAYTVNALKNVPFSEEIMMNAFVALLMPVFVLAFLLPIELKFGAEKARIMIVVISCLLFVVGMLVAKTGKSIYPALMAWFGKIEERPELAAGASMAAGIALLGVSCRISIGIMNKKEF